MTSAINRYYDPTTDEFLSIDPKVATTDQPYVFTNDDPLNAEDPMGLAGARFSEELLLEYGERYSGGVRGGDFPKVAAPDQVLYRANGDEITSYQAYGQDGLPEYRVDLTGASHGGVDTPQLMKFVRNTNPETGVTYIKPGPVEPAPEELVPSQSFQAALIHGDSFDDIWQEITGSGGDGSYPKDPLGGDDATGSTDPILW